MKKRTIEADRPARLDNAPLDYEPQNEQGVVFLFSHLARKHFGLRVERIQQGFPDCIAFKGGKKISIEFEYRSRSFSQHRHNAKQCDWIVCWIHDWAKVPARLRVIELRKEFGLGFNVWFQSARGEWADVISEVDSYENWSVSSRASQGDLVLFYKASPYGLIEDIFQITGRVKYVNAGYKAGKDYMAPISRVCSLRSPIHYQELCEHAVLQNAPFVRAQMQGRHKASEYWPELYKMIIARNPAVKRALKIYGPDKLA